MIARVVTKRESTWVALSATALSALMLLAVIADDLLPKGLFRPPEALTFAFVAAGIAAGALGPWLAWTRRGQAVQVRCAEGLVEAGSVRIAASEVSALSIATAARGTSVAVGYGKGKLAFLELERAEDATRIAESFGAPQGSFGELRAPAANRWLAVPQALLSFVALVFAPLYYLAATHASTLVMSIDEKALFGVSGLVSVELGMLLLLARSLARGHAVSPRRGAWAAHVALHRGANPSSAAVAPPPEPARMSNLARGDEGVGAWLARLDAMPTEQHAYRGDAMKKDVLWDTLGDSDAAVDARMGAARVLRRRHGEQEEALVRVIDDAEVRVRVEAALDEQDDAERRLHTLGPLFRAR